MGDDDDDDDDEEQDERLALSHKYLSPGVKQDSREKRHRPLTGGCPSSLGPRHRRQSLRQQHAHVKEAFRTN